MINVRIRVRTRVGVSVPLKKDNSKIITNVLKFFVEILAGIVLFQTGGLVHRVHKRVQTLFTAPLPFQVLFDNLQYFRQRLKKKIIIKKITNVYFLFNFYSRIIKNR